MSFQQVPYITSSYLSISLLLQRLALRLVASLPIGALAIRTAIEHGSARGALLVFKGGALRDTAAFASNSTGFGFDILTCLLPLVLGPLERREVLPRVDLIVGRAVNGLVGALLGTKLVHEVVSLLIRDSREATFEELLDKLNRRVDLLALFGFASLLGHDTLTLERPQTRVAEDGTEIGADCLKEIRVRVAQYLVDKVVHLHSDEPRLLVIDEASRLVIKSILAEGRAEIILDLVDDGIVHVQDVHLRFLFDL